MLSNTAVALSVSAPSDLEVQSITTKPNIANRVGCFSVKRFRSWQWHDLYLPCDSIRPSSGRRRQAGV
jgi:hypothetical protein